MNDFLRNLKRKANDYKKNNQHDINKAKYFSQSFYQEVMKKGEDINQKIRMEKIYIQSKYGDSIKNQTLNSVHTKWLQFRDKHLSTYATSSLEKLQGFGQFAKRTISNADIQSKLHTVQSKLSEKGYDTQKLNEYSYKGFTFFKGQFKKAYQVFNDKNLSKYFYSPLNYCGSFLMKNKSKAFKAALLLAFCYGLGSYIPVAVKDYYLQKQMLNSYQQLQFQQAQLGLEQQKLLALQNKYNQPQQLQQQPQQQQPHQ